MRKTTACAYAEAVAKAKVFIPKYGDTITLALVANFAINI